MILRNTTGSDITIAGRLIPASGYVEIDVGNKAAFANSDALITKIGNGDLAVSDGDDDLSISGAINYLKEVIQVLPTDTDGSPIQRIKTTKSGWHYQPQWMEITTSKYSGGFYNKDVDGDDLGFVTYKIYDVNDDEITDGANEGDAVKTIVYWEPTHDYEIIASKLFQSNSPTTDIRLWVVGVPDVPVAYGGSKTFAQGGINLKMLSTGSAADTDGRTSKMMYYDATNHTNKFKLIIRHDAGVQHSFAMLWEIYKE